VAPASEPAPAARAAWQVQWEKTVAAAKKEGRFVITTFSVPDRNSVQKFGVAFPEIKVEAQVLQGRDFVVRVPPEYQAGIYSYDIYLSGGTSAAAQLVPLGYVIDDTRSVLFRPDVVGDSNWIGGDFNDWWIDDDTKRYIFNHVASEGTRSFRVNRRVAPDVRTLDDWLKPEVRGKVCLEDPRTLGGGDTFFAYTMIFRGREYVRRLLTEPRPRFTRDLRQIAADMVRGDCAISVGGTFLEFERQGLAGHIEIVKVPSSPILPEFSGKLKIICCGPAKSKTVPDGDLSAGAQGPGLLKNAPHPNAARLFLNWFPTKEGQEAWLAERGQVTLSQGTFVDSCSARADVHDLCDPAKRIDGTKAYISFQYVGNVGIRDASREFAQQVLGR
jgi:iron(III) transport system substrate-binding protein